MLMGSDAGRGYIEERGLARVMDRALHVTWTTGGSLMPDAEYRVFLERGKAPAGSAATAATNGS